MLRMLLRRGAATGLAAATIGAGVYAVNSGSDHQAAGKPAPPAPPARGATVVKGPELPKENAVLTFAPNVPPPITRKHPVHLVAEMSTTVQLKNIDPQHKFPYWTFNDSVPGPFIRTRVGDTLEIRYTNNDNTGIAHNIDFHGVLGPGGGAPVLYAEPGETKVGTFKMTAPGLYVYHCAAAPVPMHVANGMYGLLLVEPEEGLPKVDKEFYIMQSEFYTTPSDDDKSILEPDYLAGLAENPSHVVFNGRAGSLTETPLVAKQNDRVRVFFGNGGPNLVSSFHIIGVIFDKVYRDGDLISPPGRGIQTTLVPAGGSTVVDFDVPIVGNFTLVDHSIFRLDKGCVGFLKVVGNQDRQDLYASAQLPVLCPGCKLHN